MKKLKMLLKRHHIPYVESYRGGIFYKYREIILNEIENNIVFVLSDKYEYDFIERMNDFMNPKEINRNYFQCSKVNVKSKNLEKEFDAAVKIETEQDVTRDVIFKRYQNWKLERARTYRMFELRREDKIEKLRSRFKITEYPDFISILIHGFDIRVSGDLRSIIEINAPELSLDEVIERLNKK